MKIRMQDITITVRVSGRASADKVRDAMINGAASTTFGTTQEGVRAELREFAVKDVQVEQPR